MLAATVTIPLSTVFLVAAPIAALGLLVVLFLKEVPLRGAGGPAPAREPMTFGAPRGLRGT